MKQTIKLVALDVDGTLLNSKHQLTARTEQALRRLIAKKIPIILATGKMRNSTEEYIAKLGLQTPGVFTQGLLITNGDGTIRYETTLDDMLVHEVEQFAQRHEIPFVAYTSQAIITLARNEFTDRLIAYHEPPPIEVASLREERVNKLILMKDVQTIERIRPFLETMLNKRATVVQALADMVEILPFNSSKGAGLRRLLADLEIAPEHVLAVGDGENDVEMLTMVGIGIAMGNGMPAAKAAANYVTLTNDEDGLALALEKFLL